MLRVSTLTQRLARHGIATACKEARAHHHEASRTLEVERKFAPTPTSLALLRSNTGNPRFKHFQPLPTRKISDTYYDSNAILIKKGIYIRLRNSKWNAKIRLAGDLINSQFHEANDEEEIRSIVERETGVKSLKSLVLYAKFETTREAWIADGFTVCVDQMDFEAPLIGEVELEVDAGSYGADGDGLDGRIDGFMRAHEWAFPTGKVTGKLSLYLEMQKQGKLSC